MELVTHKKLKGARLMPWGKGTVVTGAKGFVFLAGNTATAGDYDPFKKGGGAVGDAAAQWRNVLTNIKSDLEELGRHRDFWGLTEDGLVWASKNLSVDLTADKKKQLRGVPGREAGA
jgi:enamine deaminase RidA (YjgF/YER057c/UK114 family)